jgi:hypothetical protein
MTPPPSPAARSSGGAPDTARVAVVGTGPLAAEVVRNLELVGIPAAVHAPEDAWRTLRLADLQECYCAVAAGGDHEARRRLNQLSQVAGIDFVNVSLGANGITVESFPFGSDPECACLECELELTADDGLPQAPDPIASSIAGALAAAAALHCSGQGARRLSIPELNGASTSVQLERRVGCPACATAWRAPRIIHTRNRWSARDFLRSDAPALAAQIVRLSDALVTACECADCGPVAALAGIVNRPAAQFAAAPPISPGCGAAVQIESRDTFSLGELMERFGGGPVPAKFAIAEIGGAPVCFALEAADRDGAA